MKIPWKFRYFIENLSLNLINWITRRQKDLINKVNSFPRNWIERIPHSSIHEPFLGTSPDPSTIIHTSLPITPPVGPLVRSPWRPGKETTTTTQFFPKRTQLPLDTRGKCTPPGMEAEADTLTPLSPSPYFPPLRHKAKRWPCITRLPPLLGGNINGKRLFGAIQAIIVGETENESCRVHGQVTYCGSWVPTTSAEGAATATTSSLAPCRDSGHRRGSVTIQAH